ncbi:hypothetical protein SCAR479_08626 [Seiridium cardinale]|uniref:N-acetyltransferase domain-containing protein n=1 Tax=Seiridium cardinale TaxID=138064 RepID=A0ABR2XMJ3_9PEZI
MPQSPFHIRDNLTHPDDTDFVVAAFDSCVPYCKSIGSAGMWGPELFSAKDGFVKSTEEDVLGSERYRLAGAGEAVKIFIAERILDGESGNTEAGDRQEEGATLQGQEEKDGLCYRTGDEKDGAGHPKRFLKVGMAMVKLNWFPGYIRNQAIFANLIGEAEQAGEWLYVEVMISDFRTSCTSRRGVGSALLGYIKSFAQQSGARTVFVDAWSGNGGKLVRFYESNGFMAVDAYVLQRKNKEPWPAVVLRMDLY